MIKYDHIEAPPPEILFADMDNLLDKILNILDDCLEDTELYNQLISLAVLLDQRVNNLGNQLIEN